MSEAGFEQLTAAEAAAWIREGRMSARELTEACLAVVEQREEAIAAWAFLDRDYALAQADAADDLHRHARPHGPLHGVPVAVQDVFDTQDMPTEDGTVLNAGRRPRQDAAAVAMLRQAGAIVLGKAATSELAIGAPGKTRHPKEGSRTPGPGASGAAAAVASLMAPLERRRRDRPGRVLRRLRVQADARNDTAPGPPAPVKDPRPARRPRAFGRGFGADRRVSHRL
jgi:Asp-tRNA(Asn)/Glu-tRNA(Gln) amidotransferase A subunit family amidase